jgi:hypothetical protein
VDRAATSADVGARLTGLLELPARLEALTGAARERADRLYEVRLVSGHTVPPPELEPWLAATFGSVAAVRDQTVLKVTNRVTLEATLFAPLRSHRPVDGPEHDRDLGTEIGATADDPFCRPETGTPADTFGRVRGARVITGANAALADAHHAVLVFDTHDPLAFDAQTVVDILRTGREWAERARHDDPDAVNYLLIWNCLWRAGSSIIHGHAQALIGSGSHYAGLERLRRDAARHDGDLIEETIAVHRSVGLTIDLPGDVVLVAHLTPRKERELLVIGSPGMEETDPAFADAVARTLIGYRDRIGVSSFNLALWRPPLANADGWEAIPPMVRLVDRGDPYLRPSDIGAMELYGTPIVASDPYTLIEALR